MQTMSKWSKLSLVAIGATAIGSVAVVSTPEVANAASLYGSISFTGTVGGLNLGVNPLSDTVNLSGPTAINATSGDFVGVTISNLISSFTIDRQSVTDGNNSDGLTSALYSFGPITDFITFSNGYKFSLDPGIATRNRSQIANPSGPGSLVSLIAAGFITGVFTDDSDAVVGFGGFALTAVPGQSNSYTISLSTVPTDIPTPALLPGLIGLGFAAWRRKQDSTGEEIT